MNVLLALQFPRQPLWVGTTPVAWAGGVQAEHFRTAVADYVQGTQQLVECGAEVSREVLMPLKEQADKAAKQLEGRAEHIRADVAA